MIPQPREQQAVEPIPPLVASAALASALIGDEGGRIEAPGLTLEIPAGALGEPIQLSVFEAPSPFPERELLTPVFRFEPDGLTFDAPATVELTIPDGQAGVVFWSRPDGSGYELVGLAHDGVGRASVGHFSEGYADGCGDTVDLCLCDADMEPHGVVCGHDPKRTGATAPQTRATPSSAQRRRRPPAGSGAT